MRNDHITQQNPEFRIMIVIISWVRVVEDGWSWELTHDSGFWILDFAGENASSSRIMASVTRWDKAEQNSKSRLVLLQNSEGGLWWVFFTLCLKQSLAKSWASLALSLQLQQNQKHASPDHFTGFCSCKGAEFWGTKIRDLGVQNHLWNLII